VLGSIAAKYGSGYLGARLVGFTPKDSYIAGIATIPQLSTTLDVVFTAVELGLLGEELVTSMVILSIVTTIIAPLALRRATVGWLS
jgi:Kef-type K+ transport system membrane component KefB